MAVSSRFQRDSAQIPLGFPSARARASRPVPSVDQNPRSSSTDFVGSHLLKSCGKPKIKPTPRPVVRFPQLCAITKEQFQPDGGWKNAVMDRVIALGYACPEPEQVRRAMDAVDHVHRLRVLPKPIPARMTIEPAPRPIGRDEARDILAAIFRRLA